MKGAIQFCACENVAYNKVKCGFIQSFLGKRERERERSERKNGGVLGKFKSIHRNQHKIYSGHVHIIFFFLSLLTQPAMISL